MKRFVKNVTIVVLLVLVTIAMYYVGQYLLNIGKPSSFGPELYYAIDLAGTETGYEEVIIGDSVARLVFAPEYQDETDKMCYLATNQAITVLGNYLLLNEYLENNSQTKTVYYILRPQSLGNPLWYNLSYQYFIIPFYNDRYKGYIDEATCEYIEERFGKIYATNELVKSFIDKNSYYLDVYLNNILEQQLEERDEKHISKLAAGYLAKMKSLCDEKGVELKVICAPLPDTEDNHDWEEMKEQFAYYGISDIMADYFTDNDYYDESCFQDAAHFTDEYLSENREEIIKKIFNQ